MPTPTYLQWRTGSGPGMTASTVRERTLQALAAYITGTNPDGTVRGT